MNPEEIIQAYENGERELEPLLEKMGWKSWLGVAELGLVLQSDIVTFLEDTYGIDVADEDIDPDIFRNVLCIASYVEHKRSQKP